MAFPSKLLTQLPESSRGFLLQFFSKCPAQTAALLFKAEYPSGLSLVTTDDSCSSVFFLLKGRLQAIEERVDEMPYRFTELVPRPLQIVGDFELFTGFRGRYITLTTLEPCTFLVMPADAYLYWIKNDAGALFLRIQMLIVQMAEQSRHERQERFLDNRTRFLLYLQDEYRKSGAQEYTIPYTRDETASRIGCSVRTLNRLVQTLKDERLLSTIHGKIHINAEQAERLLPPCK